LQLFVLLVELLALAQLELLLAELARLVFLSSNIKFRRLQWRQEELFRLRFHWRFFCSFTPLNKI
jgi:hypothetical protein